MIWWMIATVCAFFGKGLVWFCKYTGIHNDTELWK